MTLRPAKVEITEISCYSNLAKLGSSSEAATLQPVERCIPRFRKPAHHDFRTLVSGPLLVRKEPADRSHSAIRHPLNKKNLAALRKVIRNQAPLGPQAIQIIADYRRLKQNAAIRQL
jgi:hypothetical protein